MSLLSWIKVTNANSGKVENKCESESKKNQQKEYKKKLKKKKSEKYKHKKNLHQLYQKSKICDYMNLHEEYKKELAAKIDSKEDGDHHGDLHTRKNKESVRVWFTNPCGIGIDPNKIKNHNSFYFLCYKSKCDIFGLAETNVNWHHLKGSASFYSRVKYYWKKFKTVTTHNLHAKHGINQRGGTCAAAINQIAHRVNKVGKDSSGLGRWVWIDFVGRENHTTRVYTAYRPGNKPPKTSKRTTVYHQHAQYIKDHKLNTNPWDMFDEDIVTDIEKNKESKNIILMLDINQDAITGSFNTRMNELGLFNAFITRPQGNLPPTHHRGSRPISAIYHSTSLQVMRAGILPIGSGVGGDHRNMFVDFSTSSFLGQQMYIVPEHDIKTLHLKDPRVYNKFIKVLRDHLQQNNMIKRGQLLLSKAKYPPTAESIIQMEELDSQLGRGISTALKKCRKIRMGRIPFSAMFKELSEQRRLWLLIYKRKLGQKISSSLLRRLSAKAGHKKPLTYTIEEIKFKQRECEKAYDALIPHAPGERRRFLEELAAVKASEMKIPRSKMIKRIMRAEQIRDQNSIIRSHFPKCKGPSQRVNKVEVPTTEGYKEINKPHELVKALQNENKEKYNCTDHTPLMEKRIHKKFGNFGETLYTEKMQNGLVPPPDSVPPSTQDMLLKTQYSKKIPRIPVIITKEEIRSTWRITKENKASSPSGRYNSVYKAMTMDPLLLNFLTTSMNLPFLTGHPYPRWSTYLDIMAFKKTNSIKIDTLRSIILSEADWNAAGRIYVTRKMMGQAEHLGLLPEEHLGGRKGRKSIDGAITKQLYLDNVRSTTTPTVILSTDAANCYDRMVHKYIAMMCSKWGLEKQVLKALLQPLQEARHFTRTSYGDSTTSFTGKNFQGAGQGNTGAAPYWTCVSTSMIELMKEAGFDATLITPFSKEYIILSLIAFVDDAELFLTTNSNNIDELIKKAQSALEKWKSVLLATGGAMRSQKCAWLLLDHAKKTSHETHQLLLKDDDGIVREIYKYNSDEPREYLGVTQTASNNDDHQLQVIHKHVQEWNDLISKSKLPPFLNLQALMNRIHRKIQYPLPATNLSHEQLQEVSDVLYRTSLPKCGIIRKFPIRFRTIPSHYFGLGLPDLYVDMQIGKMKEFLRHCMTKTVLGQQIQMSLETMQMQAGVQHIILNYNFKRYSMLVNPGWMTHMWQFISENGYNLQGWKNDLEPQREGDKFIMEEIIKQGYDKNKLIRLNKCRTYLQVITLADISNGEGNKISKNFLDGKRDPARRSKFKWSELSRPTFNAWKEWVDVINTVFCSTDNGNTLLQPLGTWLHTKYHDWDWYYDPKCVSLYYVQQRHIIRYTSTIRSNMTTRSHCRWYKAREILKSTLDTRTMERASVDRESKGVRLVSFQGSAKIDLNTNTKTDSSPPTNLAQIVSLEKMNIPPMHIHNFQSITLSEVQWILKKGLRIVADGSYKKNGSSYATILESKDKKVQIVFSGTTAENDSNDIKNTDPYRSEMMGLYMGLLMTYMMEQYTNIPSTIILSSDNDSALDSVGTYTWTNVSHQHYDIIQSSINLRSKLRSSIQIERVLGHADTKSPKRKATRTEMLNQSCDFLAKHTRVNAKIIGPMTLPFEGISLWRNKTKMYHDFDSTVREAYYKCKAQPVLSEKFNWTAQQVNMVDWEANKRSMKSLSTYSVVWIAKYVTGFLPIGVNMERRNEWSRNYCSRCRCEIETREHIAKCTEVSSTQLFQESLEQFEKWLEKMQTPTILRTHILMRITAWRMNIPWPNVMDRPIPTPILSQLNIGNWSHFMEGRIHIDWKIHMQHHYDTIHSKRTGEQWVAQCIQRIWSLFHIAQWHKRNKFVHNQTEATRSSRKREELQYRLIRAYKAETKTNLLVRDQNLYDEPLHKLLSCSDDVLVAWLEDMRLAIRDRDEFFQQSEQGCSNLRTWMIPKRPSGNTHTTKPSKRLKITRDPVGWTINGTKEDMRKGSWKPP